ncbi:MAG: hypothetical protein Q8Q21_01450 [bacterium]|nr:hypothetical protein [bacterium]
MISKIKKIILCLILAVTIFQASAPALSQVGVIGVVYAEETVEKENNVYAKTACGATAILGCVAVGIYEITKFIHYLSTFVTWAGGEIFDGAMLFSITGSVFDVGIIDVGWKLMRDFANLFFIFIILYIAIATILQIGTYGGKELLAKVIMVAVLINFSLLFARMIVDASHVLAWSFYNKIDTQGQAKFPEIMGSIKIYTEVEKDGVAKVVSGALVAGSSVGNVVGGTIHNYSSIENFGEAVADQAKWWWEDTKKTWTNWGWQAEEADETKKNSEEKTIEELKNGGALEVTFMQLSILYILSATLNFILGFIFFAGAALFIIRVVVLWILMIFAPLGFISPIMPKALAAHAGKWWDTLIRQSFFAPAYLFMLLIVTEIINSNFLKGTITAAQGNPADKFLPFSIDGTLITIFHFMVVAFLMIMALYVAKQMGAIGSDMAMKYGNQAGNFARNKFGDRAAMRLGRYGISMGGYGARRTAGLAGEGLLRSQLDKDGKQNKFGKIIGSIPLVNSGFARASTWREKQVKDEEESRKKKFGSYSDASLTAMKGQVFTKSASKTIEGIEKEREEKKNIEEKDKEQYYDNLAKLSGRTKAYVESRIQGGLRSSLDVDIATRDTAIKDAVNQAKSYIQNNLSIKEAELMKLSAQLDKEVKAGVGTIATERNIAAAKNEIAKYKGHNAVAEQKLKERIEKAKSVVNFENKK